MKRIDIYYSEIPEKPLKPDAYRNYLAQLPRQLQEINKKYQFWNNRHAHLFGKLMLKDAIQKISNNTHTLKDLKYSKYKRPYISSEFDFNISHSGNKVLLAFSAATKVGVDIEAYRKIQLQFLKSAMTNNQWKLIEQSEQPEQEFLKFWTKKESISKAIGKGLQIAFDQLDFTNEPDCFMYENQNWYSFPLQMFSGCSAFLTSSEQDCCLYIKKYCF